MGIKCNFCKGLEFAQGGSFTNNSTLSSKFKTKKKDIIQEQILLLSRSNVYLNLVVLE